MAQLPTPIIPLLTPHARALSVYLLARGLNARPMSWPIVPKGTDRVRVCLHAGNTRSEIDALVNASVAWAASLVQHEQAGPGGDRTGIKGSIIGGNNGMVQSEGEGLRSKL